MGVLFLASCEKTTLNGGKFVAEGEVLGAIITKAADADNPLETFEGFLGEGCRYSEDLSLQRIDLERDTFFATQKQVAVNKA